MTAFQQALKIYNRTESNNINFDKSSTNPYNIGQIRVIPVIGVLSRRINLLDSISGGTSTDLLYNEVNKAILDPNIKAIVLEVDSPGGEVNGTSALSELIFRNRAVKPIYSYISGSGFSAAYWIASSAIEVWANKTAQVGSIGAVMTVSRETDSSTLEIVSSQSPDKRVDPTTESGRAKLQAEIDDIASIFIEDIKRNRVIDSTLDGASVIAGKGLDAGLIDSISEFSDLINYIKQGVIMEDMTNSLIAEKERQSLILERAKKSNLSISEVQDYLLDSSKTITDLNSYLLDKIDLKRQSVLDKAELKEVNSIIPKIESNLDDLELQARKMAGLK